LNHSEMLFDVLIFLMAAVTVVPIFKRFNTSPILGYLAAGILVGPHGFAAIQDSQNAEILAEFGVVFLLFMIGLELSAESLRAMSRYVFGLGALQVFITGALIASVAWLLGFDVDGAMIIGGGLALSSTAFVIQLLLEKGERASVHGNTSFAVLLFQDLAIVPLLILTTLLGQGEGSILSALGVAALEASAVLIGVVIIGRLILRPIYRIVAETRSSELFIATTLLVVLGTGWLMSLAGISMVLGAFLAGLLLSETEYKHQVGADIRPFRGLLLGLFFMTVGMSINLALIQSELATISLLVVALMLGKSLITFILCKVFGLSTETSLRTGLILSQGGEFGFILFMTASALGLLAVETAQTLLAAVAITMVATPFMAYVGNRVSASLPKDSEEAQSGLKHFEADLQGHVLIAGFGRVGQAVAKVLTAADIPFIALDMDAGRITTCRQKGLPVFFGDARQIDTLKSAGAGRAKSMVVTIDQPEQADSIVAALVGNFPSLPIVVRAKDLAHGLHLESRGATQAVPEALEASLQLGASAMSTMGVGPDDVIEIIQNVRSDEHAALENTLTG